jgi:hypothetical protein
VSQKPNDLWEPFESLSTYGRYDWLHGDRFDDTEAGGVTGPVGPREWAAVAVAYALNMLLRERLRDDGSIISADHSVKPLTAMIARA